MSQALFAGLVVDEFDQPVDTAFVGEEPHYVINDAGFLRHISAEKVDRQVLDQMSALIEGNEEELGAQTAKMLGQDDLFSRAMLINQLKNIEQQFSALLGMGIPEEMRAYLGMSGFKVVINMHGDVLEVQQPGMSAPGDGEE